MKTHRPNSGIYNFLVVRSLARYMASPSLNLIDDLFNQDSNPFIVF